MYKISYNLKSFDIDSLIQTEKYLLFLFSFLKLDQIKRQVKPQNCQKITVCRSPHIDKKSREQFQVVRHKKVLIQTLPNKKSVLLLFEILKEMRLVGVELEISLEFSTF